MAQGLFSSGTTSVARPTEPSTGSLTYSNTASPTVTFEFTPAVVGAAATAWTVTTNTDGSSILKTTATPASQTFVYTTGGTAEVYVSAINANGTSGRKTTIGTINNAPVVTLDWMVVAGGGSGGFAYSGATGDRYATGGGGGGGYRTGNSISLLVNSGFVLNLTVGAGGAQNTSGGNSRFGTINVTGGGKGSTTGPTQQTAAATGGSGGGGSAASPNTDGAAGNAGSYSPVEGFAGGSGSSSANTGGGGGGGAAAVGGNNSGQTGGAGGAGANNTTFNINVAGGGGGGAGYSSGNGTIGGAGGVGGGGAGNHSGVGTNGTTNLGGGGGGSKGNIDNGSIGGSGVIRIKTSSVLNATFTGGVTQTNSTADGLTTYVITAAGAADTVTFS